MVVDWGGLGGYVTAQWFSEGELLSGTFPRIVLVQADGPDE